MLLDGVKENKKKLFVPFLKILRSVIRYPIGFLSYLFVVIQIFVSMCKKNKNRNTHKQCEIN